MANKVLDLAEYRLPVLLDAPFKPVAVAPDSPALVEEYVDRVLRFLLRERQQYMKLHKHHHHHEDEDEDEEDENHDDEGEDDVPAPRGTFGEKRRMLRALWTVREPGYIPSNIQHDMDAILQREQVWRGVTDAASLPRVATMLGLPEDTVEQKWVLWRGDITSLRVDCIVNAANSALLGCFRAYHTCIDNCIHSAAGPQLREDCASIMSLQDQHTGEPVGAAKATRAYNLPSRFVLHTVGPAIPQSQGGVVTAEQDEQLASSYRACLDLASKLPDVTSIAFCCVSTGVFGFPQARAANIAITTVRDWMAVNKSIELVVFNVFGHDDEQLYQRVLRAAHPSLSPHRELSLPATQSLRDELARAASWLKSADCILIAAGAGMSAAAGLDYNDRELFARLFPAMRRRGHLCMYEFIGYKGWSEALRWGYLLSHIDLARFNWPLHPIYGQLLQIVKDRDYFVMTSNVDGMFERNGFDKERIYTPQGDYAAMQCLKPCTTEVWPMRPFMERALPFVSKETQEITNPDVVPKCPNCSGPVVMNVRGGDWFLDWPYKQQKQKFQQWASATHGRRLVVLEIGAGFNTPSVIRWPSEDLVASNIESHLVRVNMEHPNVPGEIMARSLQLACEANTVVDALWQGHTQQ